MIFPKYFLFLFCFTIFSWQALAEAIKGAWVCSVYNLDFPKKKGARAQQNEIRKIVRLAKEAGLNALFVQVRPECDALYRSRFEPWSRFLTGIQGKNPGYDPLQLFIREGKKQSIAIHAWVNPYRVAVDFRKARSSRHVSKKLKKYVYQIGNQLWLDPGSAEVQKHLLAVIKDLILHYDLAGLHLDDYFYPYPSKTYQPEDFPDDATYSAYRSQGGKLGRSDWRRSNVNKTIRSLYHLVKQERPGLLFGVSPFGIYSKGQPEGIITGLDQLEELYADPVFWLREGIVDYLAPQLYWAERSPQSFSQLLSWWRSSAANPHCIPIYAGLALDRLHSKDWPVLEIRRQLELERKISPGKAAGFIAFHFSYIASNYKGVTNSFRR